MSLIDRIREDTKAGLAEGGISDDGESDDLSLEYVTDEEVYKLLAAAEESPGEDVERTTGINDAGHEVAMEVQYGSNVYFIGRAVYFYWVDQRNSYRCTTQARRWSYVNGATIVRRCSDTGRWIYQLTRWI